MPQSVAGAAATAGTGAGTLPVAVVVVAYNSGPALRGCVEAALAERPAELVVVDNASTDGCTDFLAELGDRHDGTAIVCRRLLHNEGFAQGCNLGASHSAAPNLLWLNDDAMLRPGYLRTLCAALERRPDAASAIGKVVYLEGGQQRIDSAGIILVRHALRPQDRGQDELDVGQYDVAEDIFGPTGAAALYRRRAFAEAGGFDASLFAYYEDVDLAWRLGARGYTHLYVPNAVVQHRRRGPWGRPPELAARAFVNRYRVWARNEPALRFARYAPVALAWEAARLARMGLRQPALMPRIARDLAAWLRPT